MIVTCPDCGSRYAVDPLAIGPTGRTVQCVRCDHRWFQTEGTVSTADAVSRLPAAGVASALPAVIPPKRATGWRRAMTAAAAGVVLVAATLFAFRDDILTIVFYEAQASTPTQVTAASSPPTAARVSTAPSLAASGLGSGPSARPAKPTQGESPRPNIEVDLASSKIDLVDGRYVIRGELVNNGKAAGSTTLLRLTFKKNEDVVGERSFPMVEGPLPPGGRTSFTQALDDPPPGTTDIVPAVE